MASDHAAITAGFARPALRSAARALVRGDLRTAESLARDTLARFPGDIAATVMLADIAARVGIYLEAERQLREVLDHVPDYADARVNLALVLYPAGRVEDALAQLDTVLAVDSRNVRAAASKADILGQIGEYSGAEQTYRALLARVEDRADIWMWFGHLLKTVGRQNAAVDAYRKATTLDPDLAEAWWSLAELKADRVEADDIAAMERALARSKSDDKRVFLRFALGKAYEDRAEWELSFEHYAAANRHRLKLEPHNRHAVTAEVDRSIAFYDRRFFAARADWGHLAPDPIFIVGLPRSGSTLIEQILASHSHIEGTAELPDIPLIVQALVAERWRDVNAAYPDVVATLDQARAEELGRRYLASAARHRKSSAPFFIDKLPNNWRYLGLIHLILPKARIIDARRDAMACCFSNYKQHFARGQSFAYSLDDVGAYYQDYTRALCHFDTVLPRCAYRVQHETLLSDPETEIRLLLDHLGLPFEDACLRPHENTRPVRTASSEQVRRPINRDAIDGWRYYEPWLGDLRAALGDAA